MSRHPLLLKTGILLLLAGFSLKSASAPASPAGVQETAAPGANSTAVIKAEASLVLVDVIATDKKGEYIKDLKQKEFHVYEDDAEQPISAFSHETDIQPDAPARQRYIVLFFDDSTIEPSLQAQARQAAAKMVESTASTNRLMAIVDFDGTLKIAQNFTADGDLLKEAVTSPHYAAVHPNAGGSMQLASMGAPSLAATASGFAARSVLLSIRELAKNLHEVPGRKTMILFSGGFALTPERQSELTATIDALNKSNIAVYPVDARGLAVSTSPGGITSPSVPAARPGGFPPSSRWTAPESPFPHFSALLAALAMPPLPEPQRGGVGGAGGGGNAGGSGSGTTVAGGSSRGTTSSTSTNSTNSSTSRSTSYVNNSNVNNTRTNNLNNYNNTNCTNPSMLGTYGTTSPNCVNRQIIPEMPNSVATNQQVLYALARGTGGFEIFNTNDFLQGLEKVARETHEYYNLGYAPPGRSHDGSYRKIRVKVDRAGIMLRYRTGYYDVKSPDLLKDKPEGKALEARASSTEAGEIPVSLTVPYFYTEPGVARVNLALSVPGSAIVFAKDRASFHSDVNVLGIAYRENGSVAARFSDTVKLDFEKKEIKGFAKAPFNYQNTFNIAPGTYTLKLVLSSGGDKFGKYVTPLIIEPFSGDNLSLGGPALGDSYVPVSQLTAHMDEALLEERTPLVFKGMELVPSTNSRFPKATEPVVYLEFYDPVLKDPNPPRAGVLFNIVDRKTNQQVYSSNTLLIDEYVQTGSPLVPVGFKLPISSLPSGDYRMEIKGRDAAGNVSSVRTAEFTIE